MATSFIENTKYKLTDEFPHLTYKDLRYADRGFSVPFKLSLTDHDQPLICEEVLRIIPGTRFVAYATWGDKSVVAKIFYDGANARRHLLRELDGIEQLKSVNIPSPKLIWQGSSDKNKIQILIFERIINGCSLEEVWRNRLESDDLFQLLKAVTIELATQHVLGIVQRDLHLKNFYITPKQIYTLDAGSIVQVEGILAREASLNHLALFFAQLGVGQELLQKQLFQTYAHARGWLIKKNDIKFLNNAILKHNEKRWQRFKKKIYRNSSTFVCLKRPTEIAIYDQNHYNKHLEAFLQSPDSFIPHGVMLKEGRSSTVAKIKLDDRYYVVKRYNIKSFWHGLRRCLRSTRAARSWQLAQQLSLFNVPTPKPICFVEKRFLGFRGKSYFLMEYIEGPHLGEFFFDKINTDEFEPMAKQVVNLITNLSKLRLTHGDLKMTNILVHKHKAYLIDLESIAEHPSRGSLKRAFCKEWDRFMQNWAMRPTVKALFNKLNPCN